MESELHTFDLSKYNENVIQEKTRPSQMLLSAEVSTPSKYDFLVVLWDNCCSQALFFQKYEKIERDYSQIIYLTKKPKKFYSL